MSSIFVFNSGGDSDSEEEMRLGTPDASEAKDLERHVDRCATRYKLFTKRLRAQGSQISRIELLLYGVGIYVMASGGPVHDFIKELIFK